MDPTTLAKKRAGLREIYITTANSILDNLLESAPKSVYSSDDLTRLNVTLSLADFEAPSNAFLFEPVSLQEFQKFTIVYSQLPEGADFLLTKFDEIRDRVKREKGPPEEPSRNGKRAQQIFIHLEQYYIHLQKIGDGPRDFFRTHNRWCRVG